MKVLGAKGGGPLVSVVIPAWNAESALAETLGSAAAQTHRNLEILIVDDGSTDGTARIATEFCASDNRARLISQKNCGVASARNSAIDESRGEFIAPLDADDLWHPQKIERQLETFARGPPEVGLVYCWYRLIDERGRVIAPLWSPVIEGAAFREHLKLNFACGSTCLFRRSAIGDLRYSSELRDARNGGCEDWLFQLQIAADHQIACTQMFLADYRVSRGAMSSDPLRMARSHLQMYEIIRRDLPRRERRTVEVELTRWRAIHALLCLEQSRSVGSIRELARAFVSAPLLVGDTILFRRHREHDPARFFARELGSSATGAGLRLRQPSPLAAVQNGAAGED
jgi:glycosyltransferase involved in cell wall biosynthesis